MFVKAKVATYKFVWHTFSARYSIIDFSLNNFYEKVFTHVKKPMNITQNLAPFFP